MLEGESELNSYGNNSGLRPTYPETCLLMKRWAIVIPMSLSYYRINERVLLYYKEVAC